MNKCEYYMIARVQRQNEVLRGDGLVGTNSYVERGCFHCTGYNTECKAYYPSKPTREMENKGLVRRLE